MNGIDVSFCQSNVNWSAVTDAGYGDFAIIRAGYGRHTSQKDVQFENHYAGAKAAGIPVGAYWYSYATTPSEARLEAQICMDVIKGKTFEFPIYFDLEEQSAFNTGRTNCTEMVKAFCGELEANGYFAGLYMSRGPFVSYIDSSIRDRYALWLAEWSSALHYDGQVGMWQFSETGRIPGISGDVDLDECYVDYPSIIVKGGFNGFPKQEEPMEPIELTHDEKTELRIPYIPNMTASEIQTYTTWVSNKGAGVYEDTIDGFRDFLSHNS